MSYVILNPNVDLRCSDPSYNFVLIKKFNKIHLFKIRRDLINAHSTTDPIIELIQCWNWNMHWERMAPLQQIFTTTLYSFISNNCGVSFYESYEEFISKHLEELL